MEGGCCSGGRSGRRHLPFSRPTFLDVVVMMVASSAAIIAVEKTAGADRRCASLLKFAD